MKANVDWKDFWNRFPTQFTKDEFLKQVAKTVQGKPITSVQFDRIVLDVIQKLEMNVDDDVLDLCCGNGLITSAIAEKCNSIVGVDFSRPLIEIAQEYHSLVNTKYFNLSVLDIKFENLHIPRPFTKIYMYEGLQYFHEDKLPDLIQTLLAISNENVIMLFGGVPDKSKIWDFYDTPERQREYERRKAQGTEAIGSWWEKSIIRQVCRRYELQCEFLPQHEFSHTAHYRFDIRIKK
jgi:cyclopropane fatty-acyl-phospholipid synthase-like methyltransferase